MLNLQVPFLQLQLLESHVYSDGFGIHVADPMNKKTIRIPQKINAVLRAYMEAHNHT